MCSVWPKQNKRFVQTCWHVKGDIGQVNNLTPDLSVLIPYLESIHLPEYIGTWPEYIHPDRIVLTCDLWHHLPMQVLSQSMSDMPEILYEFYMPHSAEGVGKEEVYRWEAGTWGDCSRHCNTGGWMTEVSTLSTNVTEHQWGTYRTNQPGGAATRALCHQPPPLPHYAAFIHYIQHSLTHIVEMPYRCNSWSRK